MKTITVQVSASIDVEVEDEYRATAAALAVVEEAIMGLARNGVGGIDQISDLFVRTVQDEH